MMIFYFFIALTALEGFSYLFCRWVGFPSGVFVNRREPKITPGLVRKFFEHGYDPELGWIRKPNTFKVDSGKPYGIDQSGSRCNPGHEHLPILVSTYGDSYAFCRECEDRETWQWYLAELIGGQVLNFGVGNYGLDQALMRLKREYPKNSTPVVVMAIVPETIARIQSVWKHYYEYGNLLGFKPRYVLEGDKLKLVPNYIDSEEKFYRIGEFIDEVRRNDYFYHSQFQKDSLSFPYLLSLAKRPKKVAVFLLKLARNILERLHRKINTIDEWIVSLSSNSGARASARMFSDPNASKLLLKLVEEFARYVREKGSRPFLVFLPMKNDLVYIRKWGHFYRDFIKRAGNALEAADLADVLLDGGNFDRYFARWHYNNEGNKLVAQELARCLQKKNLRAVGY